ncbi:hypothetical protein ABZ408_38905 [Streptomyces tibetensis]|uniref:SnoaL-like domain-containing protein n=1 Tax=Streptomyces tibetensis TaxID=2382123 RepID=A0ABW6N5M0_9ACTN
MQLRDDQQPLTGAPALRELCAGIAKGLADSKHVWTTTVLDDGRIALRWLHASRRVDDRLVALSGIEYATLDADGLITSLDNRMVTPDSRL